MWLSYHPKWKPEIHLQTIRTNNKNAILLNINFDKHGFNAETGIGN